MSSIIDIHPASRADIPIIAEWQIAMARESEGMALDPDTVMRGVTHVFDHPDVGYYLVAKISGQPVACTLILTEWSDWRAGNVLWIHSLFVLPVARRQHVFRGIYDYLKAKVTFDPSLRGIRLYVDKANQNAIKAYEKVGMSADHYQLFEWMK